MMKKRVRILGVFGVISLLSYTAMVVLSLTALVLVAIGAGKEPIPSLQGWTLLCLAAMIVGPLGTALLPKAVFGLFERFSTFSAVVFNAVLGVYLLTGRLPSKETAANTD